MGLVEAGDHGGARAEARALLADPAATDLERDAAAAVVASLAPDRGVVAAGAAGVAAAVAVAIAVLLRG
jgi:hypothetical protein